MKTKIVEAINRSHSVLLTAHYSPDGDNIGSQLALYFALKRLGKEVEMINADPVPGRYSFLPGADRFRVSRKIDRDYDIMFVLDCGEIERLGGLTAERAGFLINIDHHQGCGDFADITWCRESACATGELIYELLLELGAEIDKDIAVCLYVSIATDTGFFRFANTNARTMTIASDLLARGADAGKISELIYEREPVARFRLLGKMLEKMELVCGNKVAVMTAALEDFRNTGASQEDTDSFSNYPKSIQGVEIGIIFQEIEPGIVKISMRSKGKVNVAALAREFGGGGHIRAAGFRTKESLDEIKPKLYKALVKKLTKP